MRPQQRKRRPGLLREGKQGVTGVPRPGAGWQGVRGTYIRCQHGVAGRGLVYRHGEAEGACPQAAVLQQWDPLGRDWGSDVGLDKGWEGWTWMGEEAVGGSQ